MKNKELKMKKLLLIAALLTTSIYAIETGDVNKGLRLYKKKVKVVTNISGAEMAKKHSQEEWENLFKGNGENFIKEIEENYPENKKYFKSKKFKKYLPNLKAFFIEYANDSGNVPSC
jgi:hypothetical protein